MSGPTQVFPVPGGGAPAPPAPPATGGGAGGGFVRANQQTLMWGGAGLVVVLALVNASKGARPAAEDDDSVPTLDTSRTDFYNELQPELEAIQNAINGLGERPTATVPAVPNPTEPRPVVPSVKPPAATPGPKAPVKGPKVETYMIRKGDTLSKIAKQFKVPGGVARLYFANKDTLHLAAKKHGRKNSGNGHWIYPGTRIVIPT